MNDRRTEILKATAEAANILDKFPVEDRTSFDIVGAVRALGIPFSFRPLDKLLGAAFTEGEQGILVTTQRDLSVQRFTLAHELGHILLRHRTSLDTDVGYMGRMSVGNRPIQEVGADTFASELLAPKSLMRSIAARHGWKRIELAKPMVTYQLSLRLGISYQATCWALAAQGILRQPTAAQLEAQQVKPLKLELAGEVPLSNSWVNVWRLAVQDSGSYLETGPDDVLVFQFSESASAGYLWELEDTGQRVTILDERHDLQEAFGAPTQKSFFMACETPGVWTLKFHHRRPWNKEPLSSMDITVDSRGKERGIARRVREESLARSIA